MAIQQTFEFLDEPSPLSPGTEQHCHLSRAAVPRSTAGGVEVRRGSGREGVLEVLPTSLVSPSPELSARPLPKGEVAKTNLSPNGRGDKSSTPLSVLDQLRAQVGCIHTTHTPTGQSTDDQENLSTGSTALDGLLPRSGLRADAITEWVAWADGSGAAALSMITAATRLQQIAGPLVVVCSPDQFYPPAAVALGIPAGRIIWVRPTGHADTVWAIDQALRSQATAVLWAPIGASLDDRDARRFQLAAEIGNTPGLFLRPEAVRGRPTFADIRFHVSNEQSSRQGKTPAAPATRKGQTPTAPESTRTMRVTLDRCRGGQLGRSVMVQITDAANIQQVMMTPATEYQAMRHQDESTPLHLASQLSNPQRTDKQTGKRRRA